jgi:hypothetical protein
MVSIEYEWKFDKAVRANFRMEGDWARSSVIQFGGGHAVRVHAKLECNEYNSDKQAWLAMSVSGEAGGQQQGAALHGRWMVTFNYGYDKGMGLEGVFWRWITLNFVPNIYLINNTASVKNNRSI